ncbi:MAG: phenylalanine--tRNA ligase subunit alpha, partial [bacterium]
MTDLERIGQDAAAAIAAAQQPEDLEQVRRRYFGRRGVLAGLTAGLPRIPAPERPEYG